MKSNEIKDEISINLHPMIKQRYERLTDLLFFLHSACSNCCTRFLLSFGCKTIWFYGGSGAMCTKKHLAPTDLKYHNEAYHCESSQETDHHAFGHVMQKKVLVLVATNLVFH